MFGEQFQNFLTQMEGNLFKLLKLTKPLFFQYVHLKTVKNLKNKSLILKRIEQVANRKK